MSTFILRAELAQSAILDFQKAIDAARSSEALDAICKQVSLWWGDGRLTDSDADALLERIQRLRGTQRAPAKPLAASRSMPRRHRLRSKAELDACRRRKRTLASDGSMPPQLRENYTEGERAVLWVIAAEVRAKGTCVLTIGEIADRAGVRRTTVQNTLHEARRLGHVSIQERRVHRNRNLPSIVRIVSSEWLGWLRLNAASRRAQGWVQFHQKVEHLRDSFNISGLIPVGNSGRDNRERNSIGESPMRKNPKAASK